MKTETACWVLFRILKVIEVPNASESNEVTDEEVEFVIPEPYESE